MVLLISLSFLACAAWATPSNPFSNFFRAFTLFLNAVSLASSSLASFAYVKNADRMVFISILVMCYDSDVIIYDRRTPELAV